VVAEQCRTARLVDVTATDLSKYCVDVDVKRDTEPTQCLGSHNDAPATLKTMISERI